MNKYAKLYHKILKYSKPQNGNGSRLAYKLALDQRRLLNNVYEDGSEVPDRDREIMEGYALYLEHLRSTTRLFRKYSQPKGSMKPTSEMLDAQRENRNKRRARIRVDEM